MALPDPQPGLVISYAYLWHHEHRAGRDEGAKDRPCIIVLAVFRPSQGVTVVRVVPVTHRRPVDGATAFELPHAVKRHLGLDDDVSWIILDEFNEFVWPGFDLRPVRGFAEFTYGFLPPRLFVQIVNRLQELWGEGHATAVPRD